MTRIDGIDGARVHFEVDAASMDEQPLDVLPTLDAEYFVEWQVADIAPLLNCGTSAENQIPCR